MERGDADAGGPGELRTVHAGPGVRLLDARARHPPWRCNGRHPTTSSDGRASQLSLDEIAATMGYVVGKLAKAPDGSRVLFELTGPLAR